MAKTDTLNQFAPALTLTAKAGAATIPVGAPVYVKSYDPANLVVTVEQMFGNNTATLTGAFGIVVANLGTGSSVAIGGACVILLAGGCPLAYSGLTPTPSVGDPLYVSDTGTVDVAPGTNAKQIGRVGSVDSGDVYMLVDGGLGGGGGGGSATAQVLLLAPDGDFPSGVDISALSSGIEFRTVSAGSTNFPVSIVHDNTLGASAGDTVGTLWWLKNDAPTPVFKEVGGIAATWESSMGGLANSYLTLAAAIGGSLSPLAEWRSGQLTLIGSGSGVIIDAGSAEATLTIRNTPMSGGNVHTAASNTVSMQTTNGITPDVRAEFGLYADQPFNETNDPGPFPRKEARMERRSSVLTADATPTVVDSYDFGIASGQYVVVATTNVVGVYPVTPEYIAAQRVARFFYDSSSGFTPLGPTYQPVLDDTTGSTLAVDFTTSSTALQVEVTGITATAVQWTAWTQFLVTKIS